MEQLMTSPAWPVYSPFAKEHFGRRKAEGKAEGIAEGKAERGRLRPSPSSLKLAA